MHRTNMFGGGQPPAHNFQQQPQLQQFNPLDLQTIGMVVQNWHFGLGAPYDQMTPQLAMMAAQEIQNAVQQSNQHPVRMANFNFMSRANFDNPDFQDLVYVIVIRLGLGITNREFRDYNSAGQVVVPRCVKLNASFLATTDPEFLATLPEDAQQACKENAELWQYLVALTNNQAAYVSFEEMSQPQVQRVNNGLRDAMSAAAGLRGSVANGFVSSEDYRGTTKTQYNNDGGVAQSRYSKRAEIMMGKVKGPMQEAMETFQESLPVTPAMGSVRRPYTRPAQTAEEIRKFDSNVTDFSRSLNDAALDDTPVAPVKPQAPVIPSLVMNGEEVHFVREHPDGMTAWRRSERQWYHPAWCVRTHRCRYLESTKGEVIVVSQTLSQQEQEANMIYEAHAIDPSKGLPTEKALPSPVREEAKVLYADVTKVKLDIAIDTVFGQEDTVAAALAQTQITVNQKEKKPDAFVKNYLICAPFIYTSKEAALEDADILNQIYGAKSFIHAAELMGTLMNKQVFNVLNVTLAEEVTAVLRGELGVGVTIKDFADSAKDILSVVEKKFGASIMEKLRTRERPLLRANSRVVWAAQDKDTIDYAESVYGDPDSDKNLSTEVLEKLIFIQQNVSVTWVNYTEDELAIGWPDKGPAAIQSNSLGGLQHIAEKTFNDAVGSLDFAEHYIVTNDGAKIRLHRGLLSSTCYLLTK